MDNAKRCVSQNPVNYTTAQTRCTTNTPPHGTEQIEVSKKVSLLNRLADIQYCALHGIVIPADNSNNVYTLSLEECHAKQRDRHRLEKKVLNSVVFQRSILATGLGFWANSLGTNFPRATSLCESKVTSVADNLLATERSGSCRRIGPVSQYNST